MTDPEDYGQGWQQRGLERAIRGVEESIKGLRNDQGLMEQRIATKIDQNERNREILYREMSEDITAIKIDLATQRTKIALVGGIVSLITSAVMLTIFQAL